MSGDNLAPPPLEIRIFAKALKEKARPPGFLFF
jgi:hypothetical protein